MSKNLWKFRVRRVNVLNGPITVWMIDEKISASGGRESALTYPENFTSEEAAIRYIRGRFGDDAPILLTGG